MDLLASTVLLLITLILLVVPLLEVNPYLEPTFLYVTVNTVIGATVAAALSLLTAMLLALNREGALTSRLVAAAYIPITIPPTVKGLLLLVSAVKLSLTDLLVDKFLGVILVMYLASLPIALSVWEGSREYLATMTYLRSMGIVGVRFMVTMIRMMPNTVLTSFGTAWLRAYSEFGGLLILAYYPRTLSIYLYEVWLTQGLHYVVLPSMVVVAIGLLVYYLVGRVARGD